MQSALFENLLLNASHSALPRSQIPAFLYGCAWKKDRTADLVYQALGTGFRGIDVAAQPRHYREDFAGEGLRKAISEGKVKREDLFIQTKFTSVDGQDPLDLPYDPPSSITTQVQTSIASSLKNLRHVEERADTAYLDSLVLHSPLRTLDATLEAWQACEKYVPEKIKNLGISNITLPVLQALWKTATVKPSVVQNRFHRDTNFDVPLRKFCHDKGIVYQSFWTLTANPRLLKHPSVESLAKAATVDPAVALYGLVMGLKGTVVLNGTQNHMQSDLDGLQRVIQWALENSYEWENTVKKFKDATGDDSDAEAPPDVT